MTEHTEEKGRGFARPLKPASFPMYRSRHCANNVLPTISALSIVLMEGCNTSRFAIPDISPGPASDQRREVSATLMTMRLQKRLAADNGHLPPCDMALEKSATNASHVITIE